jgi:hypothetical protein
MEKRCEVAGKKFVLQTRLQIRGRYRTRHYLFQAIRSWNIVMYVHGNTLDDSSQALSLVTTSRWAALPAVVLVPAYQSVPSNWY